MRCRALTFRRVDGRGILGELIRAVSFLVSFGAPALTFQRNRQLTMRLDMARVVVYRLPIVRNGIEDRAFLKPGCRYWSQKWHVGG